MRVHLLQLDLAWEDPEANLRNIAAACDDASLLPGDLVVLPELCTTGFSLPGAARLAEPVDGPSVRFLRSLAARHGCRFIAGLPLRDDTGRARNAALLLDASGPLARYDKTHPFSPPREGDHLPAGDRIVVPSLDGLKLSLFVCYDLRFPEIFRSAAAAGAECLVVLASWPETRAEHWRLLLRARAVENQAIVVGVNRVGSDPFFRYPGRSAVIGPHGDAWVELGDRPGWGRAELDDAEVRSWRERFPALRDRRTEAPRLEGG
jgi:predicted amidohydrolase